MRIFDRLERSIVIFIIQAIFISKQPTAWHFDSYDHKINSPPSSIGLSTSNVQTPALQNSIKKHGHFFHRFNVFCASQEIKSYLLLSNTGNICNGGNDGIQFFDQSKNTSWEERLVRSLAAESLWNIFFKLDKNGRILLHKDRSRNETSAGQVKDTEKSLKKSLRKLQSEINANHTSFDNGENQYKCDSKLLRKHLSELVLGTSVMRLKYWYLVIQNRIHDKESTDREILLQNPIHGAEDLASLLISHFSIDASCTSSTFANTDGEQYELIKAYLLQILYEMIDHHIHELKYNNKNKCQPLQQQQMIDNSNDLSDNDTFIKQLPTGQAKIVQLSIEKSLPIFLSKLLIDQYGYHSAYRLAQVSNKPGPITLRRNPIRCSSNEELCTRLLREDSIHAVPMNALRSQKNENFSDSLQNPTTTTTTTTTTNNDPVDICSTTFPTKYAVRIQSPKPNSIWGTKAWKDGQFEVQDSGSQSIVEAMELDNFLSAEDTLNNDENEKDNTKVIIDFCAGNGGKTLAIGCNILALSNGDTSTISSSYMETWKQKSLSNVHIIAHDVNSERLKQIMGSLERVGLNDEKQTSKVSIETTTNVTNIAAYSGDIVLVDAPCSSLGVIRRRPSQRWMITERQITKGFPQLQLEILQQAARKVKIGGRLIYATCSISCFENEKVASAFESLPGYKEGWEEWGFKKKNEKDYKKCFKSCSKEEGENTKEQTQRRNNWRKILPHIYDADGFFIARWKRRQ